MYKQVIILRKDLKWSEGKRIAHAIHASLGALEKANKRIVKKWVKEGAKKVVLKAKNLKQLKRLKEKAEKLGLPCCMVSDAGRTQLRKGTVTALAIGPEREELIDKVTGKLKLF